MRSFRARSRRWRVDRSAPLFLIACLGPLVLLAFSSIAFAKNSVRDEVFARVETTSAVSASLFELEMNSLAELVRAYSTRTRLVDALGDGSLAARDEEMVEFQVAELLESRPGIRGTFLTDASCVLTVMQPATPEIVGKDFSFRDWCRGVTESGEPYVSEAYRTQIAGEDLVVAAIAPVRARSDLGDGEPVAYLAAVYSLTAIQGFADELASSQGIALSIVDKRGTVIADAKGGATGDLYSRVADPVIKLGLGGGSGVREIDRDGEEVLVGYAHLETLGWVVTAEVPARTAFAGVSAMKSKVVFIASILGLVLVLAGAFLARTVGQRRTAQEIAERNELRTREILDAASDGFVSIRTDGTIVAWNSAAERLCGWAAAEASGRRLFELVIPPENRNALEEGVRQFLATGKGSMIGHRVEMEVLHKDGHRLPVELAVTASAAGDERTFNAFVHDISNRLRHQAELAEARDRALEGSRLKSEFLANMSHEIRTPMNGVLGMTTLLLDTDLDAQQRENAETVMRSGEALLDIINDVLDFSKIEAGKLDLEIIPFDIHHLATDVATLLGPAARQKSIELEVNIDQNVPRTLAGDPGRLRQVISNLVSNAIKFTECGQVRVRIGCGAIRSHELGEIVSVRVEVTDTGIGIPQAVESTIFDAFTQADASTTRRYGGTGLGLAICRDLVALMGGTIGVHSRLGQGSTFWLTLPLEIAGVQDNPPNLPGGDSGPEPANRRTIRLADSGGYLGRVLVAEDDAINRKVAAGFLGGLGYHVQFAENGAEAVAAAAASPFDLIFMDCQMTVMDGFEATQQIRSTEHGQRRTPIIALTASALQTDRQRCLEAGMDDHLTKPIRRADLSAVLARFAQHKAHSVEHALPPVTHPPADDQVRAAIAARLADLFEGLDDHDIANETSALIQSYRDRAQNYLIELTRASVDGDLDRLQHLAHALRGMASNVGADVVAASAKEIEEAARLGGLSNIDNSLDGLRAAISRADDAAALVLPQH